MEMKTISAIANNKQINKIDLFKNTCNKKYTS